MNRTTSTKSRRTAARLAGTVVALLALAGCGGQGDPATTSTMTSPATEASAITAQDLWVKAADSGMTAAFGTLRNRSGKAVRIVSASTPHSTSMELHEVVDDGGKMVMRPKEGGFEIPGGGSHLLAPGGDHLMFMDLTDPVRPGDEVKVTLQAEDGSTVTLSAPARAFSAGNEDYQPGMDGMTSGSMTGSMTGSATATP